MKRRLSCFQNRWLGIAVVLLQGLVLGAFPTQAATILTPPKSQNVPAGLDATFTASVSAAYPNTCQWEFEGGPLPAATNTTLTLTNVQPNNAGAYRLVLTDKYSSATSAVAVLVVGRVAVWTQRAVAPPVANLPLSLTNVASLAAGSDHAVALRADGTVLTWGDNAYGQTNQPLGASNVMAIAAGSYHTLALCSNGTVIAWGDNRYGQTNVPPDLTNAVGIAAGTDESLALLADGRVVNWGMKASTRQAPVNLRALNLAAGNTHYVALTPRGTLTAWGDYPYPQQLNIPSSLTNAVSIVAGFDHTLALKADGTVAAWGDNSSGECTVPATASNVVAVAAGRNYSLALCSDGSVVGWGDNFFGQLNRPARFTNVVALAGGGTFTLALRNFGSPAATRVPLNLTNRTGRPLTLLSDLTGTPPLSYQWQLNGALIPGATNSSLAFASLTQTNSGLYELVAANSLGTVTDLVATVKVVPQVSIAAWGLNGDGQCDVPMGFSNVVTVVSSLNRGLALKDDGTVFGWGASAGYQALVPPNLTNVVAIAAGDNHNLALKLDGTLASWGAPTSSAFTNISYSTLQRFIRIAAASSYSLALTTGGTVSAWVDSAGMYASLYPPAGLAGVTAIAAGSQHALALKSDGTIVGWGWNYYGQATPPLGLSQVIDIACGYYHSLALKSDGTVIAWGDNQWGQTNVPSGLANVISISSAGNHSLALRSDGTVVAWGENSYGQSQVPENLTNVLAVAGGGYHSLALVADSPPCVTQPPRSQTVPLGLTATFRTTAAGTAPLTYQWLFNGLALPGATNGSLLISNVRSADAGLYAVIVSNSLSTVTSKCANLTLGPIAAWGLNTLEQSFIPAGLTNPSAIAAGSFHTAALWPDGTVSAWGDPYAKPPPVTQVVSVVAGNGITLAVHSNGTLTAWGNTNSRLLKLPAGLTDVKAVALGEQHALALRRNGQLLAWGSPAPDYGQATVPLNLTNVAAIAAGDFHSLALRREGSVVCWGSQSTVPDGLSNVLAIAAAGSHNLALRADGTVVPWGTTAYGLNTPRPDLTNIVAIACGNTWNLALKADGSLFTWGNNCFGPAEIPAGLQPVVAASARFGHVVVLTGDGRPSVTVQPHDQVVPAAGSVTFNLMATGNPPLSYQWQYNGADLPGATNPALTLTNLPLRCSGPYRCVLSNALGTTFSQDADLQVVRPPLLFESSPAATLAPGTLRIRLAGLSGAAPIVLFSSTNLLDWQPVLTNPPVLGAWEYWVPLTPSAQTFYRAAEVP